MATNAAQRAVLITGHLVPPQITKEIATATTYAPVVGPPSPDGLDLDKCLRVASKLASKAGEFIREAFNKPKVVSSKSALDYVTETDKRCEQIILGGLRKKFPNHKFIGEESSDENVQLTDDPTWMVDPLDGTTNFLHGFPYVAVSIGLAVKKQPVLGVVFAPMQYELFTAIKGKGASVNCRPIKVSGNQQLETALMAVGLPKYRQHTNYTLSILNSFLVSNVQAVRANGSAALDLCNIACGKLDLYFEGSGICCWDVCAGAVILQEAGGHICDPFGGPLDLFSHRALAASNKTLSTAAVNCVNARKAPENAGDVPNQKK